MFFMPNQLSEQDFERLQTSLITAIEHRISPIVERVKENADDIHDLRKTVYGNGQPGMDENVRNNSKAIGEVKEDTTKIKEELKKFAPVFSFYKVGVWIGSGFGGLLIVFLWMIFTHQVVLQFP